MNPLQHEVQDIVAEVVRMLSLVRESVGLARRALVDAEVAAAALCKETDRQVDDLQDHLERRILIVIARRQPAAGDLRFLGAVYRALADIERAGDYAVHVARAGAELADRPPLKKYLDMQRILDISERMIERTVDALVESDADIAREARAMDEEIDELYEQIQRELITYMIEDSNTIGAATKLLAVARYLERLADHIENVNEHIIFWRTAERV
ncbi:MAG: phosphate signaling complex protein PhoU [Trueperaceae bacterium]